MPYGTALRWAIDFPIKMLIFCYFSRHSRYSSTVPDFVVILVLSLRNILFKQKGATALKIVPFLARPFAYLELSHKTAKNGPIEICYSFPTSNTLVSWTRIRIVFTFCYFPPPFQELWPKLPISSKRVCNRITTKKMHMFCGEFVRETWKHYMLN